MCILTEDDLFHLIKDKEIFARFELTERQKKIVMLHILKGFTFEVISGIEKCSAKRVHDIYTDAIKKMRKQMLKMIKEQAKAVYTTAAGASIHYIGGDAEVSDREFGNKKIS